MKMNRSARRNLSAQNFTTGVILALFLALAAYVTHHYTLRFDWTGSGRHTLAPQSLQALQQLKEPVTATIYVQENGDQKNQAEDLLARYQAASANFSHRFVDPDLDPAAARKEEIAVYGTTVLRMGERHEKVTAISEEALTNGLIRLQKGKEKTIRLLQGHGEHPLAPGERTSYSQVVTLLKGEGYKVEPLELAKVEAIPADTALVVLAGPLKALLPVEVERLSAWMEKAGRLMVLADPGSTTGLEEFLKAHGIRFLEGTVVDLVSRLFGGSPTTPMVDAYDKTHPITARMTVASFLPETRGVEISLTEKPGANKVNLLTGATKGWLETGSLESGTATFDEGGDKAGPIPFAAAYEEGKVRMVVAGDSDFPSDTYIGFAGNADLFLNMTRWLAEDEAFIAIRPKPVTDAGLVLPPGTQQLFFWITVLVIPLLLLGCGILVWNRRKRR